MLNEVQKGYRIGDRLLRPAMVVVAVAPPAPTGRATPATVGGETTATERQAVSSPS